jgi:CBS domain-containing protein
MKELTAAAVMTTPVITVADDWGIDKLATFFVDRNISGAPVTSAGGEVIGVVSMTDIVRHSSMPVGQGEARDTHEYYLASSGRQYTEEEMQGYHIENSSDFTVRDLMTPMLFQVAEDATVKEVADMMVRGGIHRVLVISKKKVIGIITALDMLKVLRDL